MGLLYTKPEFRGRGYARKCVKALSKHLFDALDIPPNVYIENDNSVSMSMFEKMGFERMFPAAWMRVAPVENFESEA
jgi:predicted GNAT family acetyltransferase